MRASGCDLERMVKFRRDVHQHAEKGFEEVETSRKVKEMLLFFGIEEENIKACAGTGLVVDIIGKGDAPSKGGVNTIALRADMDALPIPENNPSLPYKTVTSSAHMCGHDGHMATLLAAT